MDSIQEESVQVEEAVAVGEPIDFDVWAWTDTKPTDLGVDEMQDLRHQVLSHPTARNELKKKLSEFGATPSGQDAAKAGIGHWLCGNYGEALELLEANNASAVARYAYADACLFGGQTGLSGVVSKPGLAADLLKKSKSSSPYVTVLLMRALMIAKRYDEAAVALAESSKEFRASADGLFFEGYVKEVAGEYTEADRLYEEALEADPNHRQALFRMATWSDISGDDERAIAIYEKLAEQKPPMVNSLMNLGVLYEDADRFRDAVHCYRRVLAVYPMHPRARLFLKDAEASLDMYYDEDQEVRQDRKNQILKIPVSDFELSVRSRNCLSKMNIVTLADLVHKTEAELLSYKNFGETSLAEIKQILESKGLRLGMRPEDDLQPVRTTTTRPVAAPSFSIDPNDERLKKGVSEMALSVRARKCLATLGIKTLGELVANTTEELLGQRNFGVTSLKEITDQLEVLGLSLRTVDK